MAAPRARSGPGAVAPCDARLRRSVGRGTSVPPPAAAQGGSGDRVLGQPFGCAPARSAPRGTRPAVKRVKRELDRKIIERGRRRRAARWFENAVEAIKRLRRGRRMERLLLPAVSPKLPRRSSYSETSPLNTLARVRTGRAGVCLTRCRWCSDSGRGVDAEMRKAENMLEMALGAKKLSASRRLLDVGPARVAADFYHGGAGILMFGIAEGDVAGRATQIEEQNSTCLVGKGERGIPFHDHSASGYPPRPNGSGRLASRRVSSALMGLPTRRLELVRSQLDRRRRL